MKPDVRVFIVFTPDAAESLARCSSIGHVWVRRSPSNERVVQDYWRKPGQPFSVTLFDESNPDAAPVQRLGVLGVVEEHRWDYSNTHEYSILEVAGLPLDAAVADYLRTFGFSRLEEREDGFTACRPARPHDRV